MSCCLDLFDLGCFNHCDSITFFNSPVTGSLSLIFESSNHIVKRIYSATLGQPIILDISVLNENMEYNLTIKKADGTILQFSTTDGFKYCFKLKTKIYNEI